MSGDQPKADAIRALARRALGAMPGGASHDSRQLAPHGLFARSAAGARKTGDDGKVYIDLQCGNGALLLGHAVNSVTDAGKRALESGLNFSAGSEAEILWAETVLRLMPAAEQIRFTASGNEACALAFAVARAVTGRGSILVLRGHYCGWVGPALLSRYSAQQVMNAPASAAPVLLAEAEHSAEAIDALGSGRFAAVIFEPTGASFGRLPLGGDEVRALAAAARNSGSLCILDETLTGFRVSPGGAQGLHRVAPDLTVLGKILGGGLPCGALAGRRVHLDVLDNRPGAEPRANSHANRVSHMGTGNGNPVVAMIGTATLAAIEDGAAIARANAAAARLRDGLNRAFRDQGIPWAAYGEFSGLHLFLNSRGRMLDSLAFDPRDMPYAELAARAPRLVNDLRIALLRHGIDINPWPGGLLSAAHDDETVDEAIAGFAAALADLGNAGVQLNGWDRA